LLYPGVDASNDHLAGRVPQRDQADGRDAVVDHGQNQVHPLGAAHAGQVLLTGNQLRRKHHRGRLAEHLRSPVTEQPFGGPLPAHDAALEIHYHDGVSYRRQHPALQVACPQVARRPAGADPHRLII